MNYGLVMSYDAVKDIVTTYYSPLCYLCVNIPNVFMESSYYNNYNV